MITPRPDWLQAKAEKKWKELIDKDLNFRKENQKKREWKSNLTPAQIELIDKAESVEELDLAIRMIELKLSLAIYHPKTTGVLYLSKLHEKSKKLKKASNP